MRPSFLLFAVLSVAVQAQALRSGPVYPSKFPELDVVLELVEPALPRPGGVSLRSEDLTLIEDGAATSKASRLRAFGDTGQGVAVSVVIDASGSMSGAPIQAVREGLAGFVSRARAYDRISVATVADDTRREASWNASPDSLRQALANITTRGTRTHLWDAMSEGLDYLVDFGLPERWRLVVVSDGHDEGSGVSMEAVIAKAVEMRVPIDCVGITRSNPIYLQLLRRVAIETGGNFRAAYDTSTLKTHISDGIDRILRTPVATFRAKNVTADGKIHTIGVRWETENQTSESRVTLPLHRFHWFRWWHGALAALPLLGLFLLRSRRKTGGLPAPVPGPSPVRPVPAPVPSPVPVPVPAPNPMPIPRPGPVVRPVQRTQYGHTFASPSPDQPAAYLRGPEGLVAIDREEFWIGAEANNHCRLDLDETVSGNHACIRFEGGSLRIYDNHSTNGTWLNQQRLDESARLLSPGDRIRIGRSVFVLEGE